MVLNRVDKDFFQVDKRIYYEQFDRENAKKGTTMVELGWDRAFALEQSGDDEEMLTELLKLFCDSSSSDMAKIKQAYAVKNAHELAAAAHSIKGAAASLGIEGIRQCAHDLEKAGNAGDLSNAETMMGNLAFLLNKANDMK